jgi:hypothetical protein
MANRYGIRGLPGSFLIDRSSEIAAVAIGPRDWDSRPAMASLACQPIEIVGPEVAVGDAIADDVVRRYEDAVADGHGRLLWQKQAAGG